MPAHSAPRLFTESYAGTYLPNIASVIHKHNKSKPTPSSISIPLKSVLIGNGLTDAYTQFASVPDWSCNEPETPGANPYGPIFDEATCQSIRGKVPTCQRLTEFCYNNPSRFVESPLHSHLFLDYSARKADFCCCRIFRCADLCSGYALVLAGCRPDPAVRP